MSIQIVLTPRELIECHKHPEILRGLADYHDCCAVEAESIGGFEESITVHENRAKELRAEADRIEAEY